MHCISTLQRLLLAPLLLLAGCSAQGSKWAVTRKAFPQVISHRGASGYIPEHSINAYRTAVDLGADYIEPDLVISNDSVLVIMHDLTLDETTDVADHPEFADRKTTRLVNGKPRTGYFVSDFTFAELQTLRLKQRLESVGRTDLYDGYFKIPMFVDALNFAQEYYDDTGKLIGVYTELKSPSYHRERGWDMEQMVLDQLAASGYLIQGAPNDMKEVVPIVLQCFERAALERFRTMTDIPLIQLLEPTNTPYPGKNPFSEEVLNQVVTYADGMGPKLEYLTGMTFDNALASVNRAHELGLRLHPWTFRAEPEFIPAIFNGSQVLEYDYFLCCLAVDGLFTEFPDQARQQVAVLLGPSPKDCYSMCPQLAPEDDDRHGHDDDDDDESGKQTFIVLTAVFGAVAALALGALLFVQLRKPQKQSDIEAQTHLLN